MSLTPDDLITQGRRDLVCGDITKAVENFQKACEILSGEFGDFDDKLALPNLLYGTALLELSRMESTVIGNALDGIPEDESDNSSTDDELIEEGPALTNEEKEDLSNKVIDAMCEEDKPEESKEATEVEQEVEKDASASVEEHGSNGGDKEESEDGDSEPGDDEGEQDGEDQTNDGEAKQEVQTNGEEAKEEAEKEDDKSDDEDVSNLQIAWEVIEVAKKIFSRNEDTQSKLKVAECFEKLGEISREKEDYVQAVADLKECLTIRSAILSNDDREIAETHFQLGTTYAVSGDLDSASQSFRSSADCLIQYAQNIKAKLADKTDEDDEESKQLRASLTEVEELIPEIQRRCADVEEDRMAEKMKPSCSSKEETELPSESSKPASDISHLVRKKRPVADEAQHVNGKDANSTSNGDETNSHCKKPKLAQPDDVVTEAVSNGLPKSQDHAVANGN